MEGPPRERLRAKVVRGRGLGRRLGFPTANLGQTPGPLPPAGVYLVRVSSRDLDWREALCNVGVRPTLGGSGRLVAEVHIPGFSGDLYGRTLEVVFLRKIREERKFSSLAALKRQILQDIRSLARPARESHARAYWRRLAASAGRWLFGALMALGILEGALQVASLVVQAAAQSRSMARSLGGESLRILCLGESTTAAHWLAADLDWPAQLQRLLDEREKGRYLIINKGRYGTNTAAILARLPDYLDKYRPHLVIAMMGVNDQRWFGLEALAPAQLSMAARVIGRLRMIKAARWAWHAALETRQRRRPRVAGACSSLREGVGGVLSRPEDPLAYEAMARTFQRAGRHAQAAPLLWKAYTLGSESQHVHWHLASHYRGLGLHDEAQEVIREFIRRRRRDGLGQEDDIDHTRLAELYRDAGRADLAQQALRDQISSDPDFAGGEVLFREYKTSLEATAANYRQLQALLERRGIRLAAMQYPTLDSAPLRKILKGGRDTLFIENWRNFEQALARQGYWDLFVDNGQGRWGHCTKRGYDLIARSALEVIERAGMLAGGPRGSSNG